MLIEAFGGKQRPEQLKMIGPQETTWAILFQFWSVLPQPTVKDGPRLTSFLHHDSESQGAKSEKGKSKGNGPKKAKKPAHREAGFSHAIVFFFGEAIRQPRSSAAHVSYRASGATRCIGSSL